MRQALEKQNFTLLLLGSIGESSPGFVEGVRSQEEYPLSLSSCQGKDVESRGRSANLGEGPVGRVGRYRVFRESLARQNAKWSRVFTPSKRRADDAPDLV